MQLPMTGSWSVIVNAVRPFAIHGDLYWELIVTKPDAPGEISLRVPQHAAKVEPAAGQQLKVSFLMGQVTTIAVIS
jgi:hypothetical protein